MSFFFLGGGGGGGEGQTVILKAESLFGRIIVIGSSDGENYPLQWDLGRELCLPVTTSTVHCKTKRNAPANFFYREKRNVRMIEEIPSNSAATIDGMRLVQKVNTDR